MKYEYWQTADYGAVDSRKPNLTKARLGEFLYHLCKAGGEIYSTYVMNARYNKSYVQFAIKLPEGRRKEFEEESGFPLEPVSVLTPC